VLVPRAPASRRFVTLLVTGLLAFGAAGCGGVSRSAAADVGGHEITKSDVIPLMKELAKVPGQATSIRGQGRGTYNAEVFAQALDRLVRLEVFHRELDRRHLEVGAADRAQARSTLEQAAGAGKLEQLPTHLRDFAIDFDASQQVLSRALTDKKADAARQSQLQAAYEQQKRQLAAACLSVIAAKTRPEAVAAENRVKRGEAFATVAQQVSIDQQTASKGGTAGCQEISKLAPLIAGDVAAAKEGDVLGPYDLQGAFGIVQVTKLQVPTLDQLRPQLEAQLPQPGTAALDRVVRHADVDVNPRYGRWNAKSGRVEAPAGASGGAPASTAVPATTAVPG